jgi:predicted Zn-dependent peptidase
VSFVRNTLLRPAQVTLVRDVLLRELDKSSLDNGYLLNQIARRYEDGDSANLAAVNQQPTAIAALSGSAIQRAATRYFDPANYVKVTLMPEKK